VRSEIRPRFHHSSAHELLHILNNGQTEPAFERYLAADDEILFIDDLSGTRFCKRSAAIFFDFVTQIVRSQRILVVTVDLAGDDLARHWSALDPSIFSICQDIVGRIRDYSDVIHFAPEEKAA